MALVAAITVYLVTFNVLPEIGQDEQQVFVNIAKELTDTKGVRFVYKFKVVGESTALAVVEVTNVAKLEKIFSRIYQLGAIETTSTPVITYEAFGRNLGVAEDLTSLDYTVLQNDNLFYSQVYVDHYGNTTNEVLASFKQSVTRALILKRDGVDNGQVFKNVAERKLHIFLNYPDTVSLDNQSFHLPIEDFGSNIHFQTKGLQFLADYVAGNVYSKSVY